MVTPDALEIPLESQGFSTFGSNLAGRDWQAQRLIAHELSHQWFGNAVTTRSLAEIWLHEGFACYSEWLWSTESGGASADEWARRYRRSLSQQPQDLLLGAPGADRMFDDRVYKRGALTLHALRLRVGDEAFFAVLRAWVERYRHGVAGTADFVAPRRTGQWPFAHGILPRLVGHRATARARLVLAHARRRTHHSGQLRRVTSRHPDRT